MTFLYYLSGFVTSNVPLSVLHKHVPKTVLKRQCRPVHSHSLASTVALAQLELALLLQLLTEGGAGAVLTLLVGLTVAGVEGALSLLMTGGGVLGGDGGGDGAGG